MENKKGLPEKICAGIVLYNPDKDRLAENINAIKDQVKEIILVDNSSHESCDTIIHREGIIYLSNHVNRGIACALNQICEQSILKGYEYVLLMDQDSVAAPNLISIESEHIGTDVAVVSPRIQYRNNENYHHEKETGTDQVEWTITSGSLINLNIWEKLGGFDETLFIDGVDYDYGIRANKEQYIILRVYDTFLLQELGRLKCRKVLGKTIYVTNHSATRKYYMSRNQIYLKRKLHTGHPFRTVSGYMIKTFFFENQKHEKMKAILKGILDGLRMKPTNTYLK